MNQLLVWISEQAPFNSFGRTSGNISCLPDWDTVGRRHPLEIAWDLTLILAIFATNFFVIFIVSKSHALWKPRHFFMAALCVANLLIGLDQLYGLGLDLWPEWMPCVIYRTTLGIPIQVYSLLLTLISIDRFVAVQFPFFYESSVNNLHVLLSSVVVGAVATCLSGALIYLGFTYPQSHLSAWLMFLPFTLTASGIIILYCNAAVLKTARQQMKSNSSRPVIASCYCIEDGSSEVLTKGTTLESSIDYSNEQNSPLIGKQSLWDSNNNSFKTYTSRLLKPCRHTMNTKDFQCSSEKQCFLGRLQPSSSSNNRASASNYGSTAVAVNNGYGSQQLLMRFKPKILCIHKLSPSVKFARTVLIMTVPVLVFLMPIVVIVPLKYANDSGWCDCDEQVEVLWNYLLIHIRSVFPLQCAIDPIIYMTFSKESRRSSRSFFRRWRSDLFLERQARANLPVVTQV